MGDDESAAEAQRLIGEALARFGVAGVVEIRDRTATLRGHGPTVTADVGGALVDWVSIPDENRRRRAADVARALAANRRKTTLPAPPIRRGPSLLATLATVAGVVIVAAGLFKYYAAAATEPAPRPHPRPSASVADDSDDRDRRERAERVCEATRARVTRGAPVGPSDSEGWVVDVDLLRSAGKPDPASDPSLATFVAPASNGAPARVVWTGSPTLRAIDGPGTAVTMSDASLPVPGGSSYPGLRVELSGRYVGPYFDESGRGEYLRLAKALTEALGADYAALYARCAATASHHLGSYFRGPNPGGAVAALLFYMGTAPEAPVVRASLLSPNGGVAVDPSFAFQSLLTATGPIKKARVMEMIGKHQGMISGLDGQPAAIGFGFRDPNVASRATRQIARDLSIASDL